MCPTRSLQGKAISQGTGIIARPRLLHRLQGAFNHKLTLLTAPPGFGKTTLMTQLLRDAEIPVVWHTIDERSRDLPNLYNQALNALSSLTPSITKLATPYGYGAGELATLIGDHIAENLDQDFVYVLDDVHVLTGAVPAETWLRSLVGALPANCHLLVASRTLPRLPLVEMIARGEVLAIGLDDMRFTPDEIGQLGTVLLGQQPPDVQIQHLAERLEGWPAGTVLAFTPLPSELEQMGLSGQGGPEALFEALARNMLQTQPLKVRNFLLASSTLHRLTPEACSEALGLSGSAQMLAEIQSRNLFVSKVPGALVYHALFRSFLQSELKSLDEEQYLELHARAAQWFEENDLPDDAFDHYVDANMPTAAAALADHLATAYFTQNRVETLVTWHNRLLAVNAHAPRLAFRCAILYGDRYDYDAAEACLREVEANLSPDREDITDATIRIQYGHTSVLRGNHQAAINYVEDLADTAPESRNIRGRAFNILGIAAFATGNTEQAITYLETALPLFRIYEDNYAQSNVLQNLFAAYWRLGRLQDALKALNEVVALQRSLGGPGPLALALNNLGYAYLHLLDYEHAITALQEGLSAIARFANRRAQGYLLYNLADVRRNQGAMEDALNLYNTALSTVEDSEPSLTCSILCSISTLHRWQGQLDDALAYAQEADRLARKHQIGNEGRVARAILWAARAHIEDPADALPELKHISSELEAQQEKFDLLQTYGLCAQVALLADQRAEAEQFMVNASALGKMIGTYAPLLVEILHFPSLEDLCRREARCYGPILEALNKVRASQTVTEEESSQDQERVPDVIYSLRIITLGQALVMRDGHSIPTSAWRPAARDLFLFLVFAQKATREEICLIFWPDSPAKRARDNFHSTMYRIREVLGENTIVLQDDGNYSLSPEVSVWCDAYELEGIAAQARVLSPSDARTEDLWRRAVSLYNGEFLSTLDFEWAVTYRERLHETYIEALAGLGRCMQLRGSYREAIQTYKHVLEIEPYREDIHQAIITCHIAKGAKDKALAQLNQLRKLLRKDLGVGPSQETLQLAKSLFA